MQVFGKRFLAVVSAAVIMTSAGVHAFADTGSAVSDKPAASDTGSAKKTGYKNAWIKGEYGWRYILSDGKYAAKNPYKIDGVIYDFSYNGYAIGKHTGWIKENGVSRRYSDGVPYTGWVQDKNYCLDGYKVTGDFQIEDKVYTFDKNGVYTGKSRTSALTADCGEKVSSDEQTIWIKITAHDENGNSYAPGDPYRLERWEKGKWVDCIGDGVQYSRADEAEVITGIEGQCEPNYSVVRFKPQIYTNNNFKEGYYRFVFSEGKFSGGRIASDSQDFYWVFEVVPPITVDTSEEIYIMDSGDIQINTTAIFNSFELGWEYSNYSYARIKIMSMTPEGWKTVDQDNAKLKPSWSCSYDGEILKEILFVNYIPVSDAAAGYYKSVVTAEGEKYEKTFRIDRLGVVSWLDEYSLKSDDITVRFTLSNNTDKTIEVHPHEMTDMYKKTDGKWNYVLSRDDAAFVFVAQYLEPGEDTEAAFALDEFYSREGLKPGTYAVNIPGYGFAEFKLTDKAPDYSSMPYAKLSKDNIDKVTISLQSAGDERLRQAEFTSGDASRIVSMLKQIVIGENAEEEYNSLAGTFRFEVKVKYGDGSEKKVVFRTDEMIEYNGTIFRCRKDPYLALNDIFTDKLAAVTDEGIRSGKKTGWFEIDGTDRRYSKGKPYTGWLQNKDGTYRYCLDGYAVTGEFQIDGDIYVFGDDGIYTGEQVEYPVAADCGGELFTDTRKISVKVTLNDVSGSYEVGMPTRLERWEKGRWTECIENPGTERSGTAILDDNNKTGRITFDYRTKSEYSFVKDTYYRLTLPVKEVNGNIRTGREIYVIFKAITEYGDF